MTAELLELAIERRRAGRRTSARALSSAPPPASTRSPLRPISSAMPTASRSDLIKDLIAKERPDDGVLAEESDEESAEQRS